MNKLKVAALLFSLVLLQYCTTGNILSQEASKTPPVVSYAKDIYPVMKDRCTPCHFSPDGKKEMLETYEQTVENVENILEYIQLPKDARKFMPFKSKKPPLSDSLIAVFKLWKTQGMAK